MPDNDRFLRSVVEGAKVLPPPSRSPLMVKVNTPSGPQQMPVEAATLLMLQEIVARLDKMIAMMISAD